MLSRNGIESSLLLGPDGEEAPQIGKQIETQDTAKPGVFALEPRPTDWRYFGASDIAA
jgi:hypothetical protein